MACFLEAELLRAAVAQYLLDDEASSVVRKVYGNDIGEWCVSELHDFSFAFAGHETFNEDVSRWNVSNAVTFRNMFQGAKAFDQDVSTWDTSRVVSFKSTFEGAASFQGLGLDQWNTGAAVDMDRMFFDASAFRQNLAHWNTSHVETLRFMFDGAASFTGEGLDAWDISRVISMRGMFQNAHTFAKDLCAWRDHTVDIDTWHMFHGTKCPKPGRSLDEAAFGTTSTSTTGSGSVIGNSTETRIQRLDSLCFPCDTNQDSSTATVPQDDSIPSSRQSAWLIVTSVACMIVALIVTIWACSGWSSKPKRFAHDEHERNYETDQQYDDDHGDEEASRHANSIMEPPGAVSSRTFQPSMSRSNISEMSSGVWDFTIT